VEEIEKLREIERAEPEKLKERTRLKREKEKVDEFEKFTVECPECKSHTLVRDYERAELVCSDCGLVIDENFIDQGPEWRAFDHDQRMKRSRVGAPMTYTIHDKGLSTMIDWRNRDSYGKTISSKNRAQLYRLRKWQRRIRVSNATERNLAFALSELDRMASALGLPGTCERRQPLSTEKPWTRTSSAGGALRAWPQPRFTLLAGSAMCPAPWTRLPRFPGFHERRSAGPTDLSPASWHSN
jgi:ribosomal protein S27E